MDTRSCLTKVPSAPFSHHHPQSPNNVIRQHRVLHAHCWPHPPTMTSTAASSTSTTRPQVDLHPTTHLDPGAYIRGTHPITLGEHNLIHPRALLTTTTHPLTIGSHNTIAEKAIIGGSPVSLTSRASAPTASTTATPNLSSNPPTPQLSETASQFTESTTLHSSIQIHPHALISHSSTIHSHVTIESHAIIYPGVTVGAHSKICGGVHVTSDVPEWTVVVGNGNLRRSRFPTVPLVQRAGAKEDAAGENGNVSVSVTEADTPEEKRKARMRSAIEEAEAMRVKAVDKERDAATVLLRNAARAAMAAKRASVQRS